METSEELVVSEGKTFSLQMNGAGQRGTQINVKNWAPKPVLITAGDILRITGDPQLHVVCTDKCLDSIGNLAIFPPLMVPIANQAIIEVNPKDVICQTQ